MSVPFPGQTAYLSGAGTLTVFSGAGVFQAVFVNPLSGAQTSFSGTVLRVLDAVSGMSNIGSGRTLWALDFGVQSGLTNGVNTTLNNAFISAQEIHSTNVIVSSGLVVAGGAGMTVLVNYNK